MIFFDGQAGRGVLKPRVTHISFLIIHLYSWGVKEGTPPPPLPHQASRTGPQPRFYENTLFKHRRGGRGGGTRRGDFAPRTIYILRGREMLILGVGGGVHLKVNTVEEMGR